MKLCKHTNEWVGDTRCSICCGWYKCRHRDVTHSGPPRWNPHPSTTAAPQKQCCLRESELECNLIREYPWSPFRSGAVSARGGRRVRQIPNPFLSLPQSTPTRKSSRRLTGYKRSLLLVVFITHDQTTIATTTANDETQPGKRRGRRDRVGFRETDVGTSTANATPTPTRTRGMPMGCARTVTLSRKIIMIIRAQFEKFAAYHMGVDIVFLFFIAPWHHYHSTNSCEVSNLLIC